MTYTGESSRPELADFISSIFIGTTVAVKFRARSA